MQRVGPDLKDLEDWKGGRCFLCIPAVVQAEDIVGEVEVHQDERVEAFVYVNLHNFLVLSDRWWALTWGARSGQRQRRLFLASTNIYYY